MFLFLFYFYFIVLILLLNYNKVVSYLDELLTFFLCVKKGTCFICVFKWDQNRCPTTDKGKRNFIFREICSGNDVKDTRFMRESE